MMTGRRMFRSLVAGTMLVALAGAAPPPRAADASASVVSPAMAALLDYVQHQRTTGFLVIRDREVVVERNWPAPADDATFRMMNYGPDRDGALLEDVASQQKSFVSTLVAMAIDRHLIDVDKPVNAYLGAGWSKASPEQEAQIRVINLLTMNSGLGTDYRYQAAPGTMFLYNTQVYAVTKRVLAAAAKLPLETITHDWLTGPAGMTETSWRERPAGFTDVGNPTGLVTSPRDVAKLGQVILDGGVASDGKRIVSAASLTAMFERSATNPAYGRLWWLNGSTYTMRAVGKHEGELIPAAPADLVAALGALDRKLYVVPSRKLIVVRMGDAAIDKDFDQQLWLRLMKAIG